MAAAMIWVHTVTTIGGEMALPAYFGYWLDQRWQTSPWLVIVGAILGFVLAMYHIFQIAGVIGKQGK